MGERKYWYPQLTDGEWIARLRTDYPEDCDGMDDADVREYYADGRKYADVWDHVGDARVDWEMLADDWTSLRAQLAAKDALHYAPDLVEIADLREENKLLEERYGDCDDSRLAICKERDSLRTRVAELEALLDSCRASLTAVGGHCTQPMMAADARGLVSRVRAALEGE